MHLQTSKPRLRVSGKGVGGLRDSFDQVFSGLNFGNFRSDRHGCPSILNLPKDFKFQILAS